MTRARAARIWYPVLWIAVDDSDVCVCVCVCVCVRLAPDVGDEGLEPVRDGVDPELQGEDGREEEVDLPPSIRFINTPIKPVNTQ